MNLKIAVHTFHSAVDIKSREHDEQAPCHGPLPRASATGPCYRPRPSLASPHVSIDAREESANCVSDVALMQLII